MQNAEHSEHVATQPLSKAHVTWLATILATTAALFHLLGNNSSVQMESSSLFLWVGRQWIKSGGDFSHAWLMPLISLWFIWSRRREISAASKNTSIPGLTVVVLSLLLHWVAYRAQHPRVSLVALVGVLWGMPFYLYGWSVARLLIFPSAYLLLCFTSSILLYFTPQLRLLANALSAALLNGIGIATHRVGTALYSAAGGGFRFDVADPCSGLRSLVVMMAIAAPYAYVTQPTPLKKWMLFALSLPLALIANAIRIVTIAVVAEAFNSELAMTVYHDYSGYLLFVIATLLLVLSGVIINKPLKSWAASVPDQDEAP